MGPGGPADGKVALVAGGTRGTGFAVARTLMRRGCHVFLNYAHDEAGAKEAVTALQGEELPGTATALRSDITRPDALPRLLRGIRQHHDRLDFFVHSAVSFHPMDAADPAPEGMATDLTAALAPLVYGVRPLARAMAGGPGRVVVVSSTGARRVVPRYVGAGIAKAALEAQVRYLAVELAPLGITVNGVSTAKLDKGPGSGDSDLMRALAARTPAGRLTTPDDIAAVVALLCSDDARWIHGQVITADGGLTLRA
ncbi:SDR family oxidoreductase [Streptomyces sp. JH34]|uniref:SDR family oxidoreductase n=1 Tax=unclassified Streptomyces TaxID=2593676 RepID=UPI0023F7B474|nr:SDR family oxidoreductase [Streptomyces sp. JH34]MDF6023143.1 SDR family oxidoreductase [Streptomyces sp. JH34]